MGRGRRKQSKQRALNSASELQHAPLKLSARFWNRCLLAAALLAGLVVYWPAQHADWFYDDTDYVVNDPRLKHIELFLPWHWHDPPPPLEAQGISAEQLPGYGKPLIADRYVWRLSFALERYFFGANDSSHVAHTINLLLHLCCVCALFLALKRSLALYSSAPDWAEASESKLSSKNLWPLLPGSAALIFAVHPWAAEPVCYVAARSGSLGTLFVLLGTFFTACAFDEQRSWRSRALLVLAVPVCALLAFGCKENFISALPGCALVVAPVAWRRLGWSRAKTWGLASAILALFGVALFLAIRSSERAQGLFAQSSIARSWPYFFEIQNPLLLLTAWDQLPVRRISLEFNHPGWSAAACWAALLVNVFLLTLGTIGGFRWPLFLSIGWFYLHLLPTNSILVRQDFLAARNVYLPACGTAVLFAGLFLWFGAKLVCKARDVSPAQRRDATLALTALGLGLWTYWSATTWHWAAAFVNPIQVWAQSAKIAPDHSTVRLNLGVALLNEASELKTSHEEKSAAEWEAIAALNADAERNLTAALDAETSPTMQYHNPSHRIMRKAVAYRALGELRRDAGNFDDAERYFREAWRAKPAIIVTWVEWVDLALNTNKIDALRDAVAEGLAYWPGKWWPVAVRGMLRVKENPRQQLTPEACADLEAAERAEDAPKSALTLIQARALYFLAQSQEKRERLPELLQRLRNLGLPEKALEGLR